MLTLPRVLEVPIAALVLATAAAAGTARVGSAAEPAPRLVVFEDFTRFT